MMPSVVGSFRPDVCSATVEPHTEEGQAYPVGFTGRLGFHPDANDVERSFVGNKNCRSKAGRLVLDVVVMVPATRRVYRIGEWMS